VLAETNGSGNTSNEYVFVGGKRVALLPAGSTAQFYAEDMLGSSRIVTTNTGAVCYDADFYPFGGERTYTNSCTQNNYKFEGKERDTETGNDDFGARYYSNRFGRWLSADWSAVPEPVPYANLTNPQTLNLYAMVSDNPETFADLDGHCYVFGADNATCASALTTQAEQAAQKAAQQQAARERIARAAGNLKRNKAYEKRKRKGSYKEGSDKCNELPADVIEQAGLQRPRVRRKDFWGWLGFTRDPTSHEWADPTVNIPGWSAPKPVSEAQRGDVIAQEHNEKGDWGHVGIVIWPGSTVSVNSLTHPEGIVTENDWGFRPAGQNGEVPTDPPPVARSYIGDN
jgi:RHS repeat-associated protein